MKTSEYKNVINGEIQSVNLDLNDSNILDVSRVDQFIKTCSTNQDFLIVNENIKVFKLVLTGGSLNSTLFRHSSKQIEVIVEGGDLSNYDNSTTNRIYCFIEQTEPSIKITIVINVQE
jgi:hypothetical protein